MDKVAVYGFLVGLHTGRFTNLVTSMIITGAALYFVDFYTSSNLNYLKESIFELLTKQV